MARNQAIGRNTSLRQLKRINNKSRLKIIKGDLEQAETLLLEEGKLSWGVDTEDANEQHLQEVLVASQRAHSPPRSTRSAEKPIEAPTAYIPTPDSTGVANNYEELYLPNQWTDPEGYVRSSDVADQYIDNALANEFTYYMDERDLEWLEKNNEEARGEGTSSQGALSSGSSRSARSSKSKGKEPESVQPIAINEDEFELVMGLFEKLTHEKTEFLHHSFDGMTFPAFSEYQDTFAKPLSHTHFASLIVPEWVPESTKLLKIARVVYPHWKERRVDRNGHRIMPTLNFDEADTLNESYVCFRRRDVKAVRKTRASQTTPFDKFYRLSTELALALDIANATESREPLKKECYQQERAVFEKRLAFVECKRKVSVPGDKGDDDLIYDKERARKKASRTKTRLDDSPAPSMVPQEPFPQERYAKIQAALEADLARQKEKDVHWEDQIDNGYQLSPPPLAIRLFKYLSPRANSSSTESDEEEILPRGVRLRVGRGGRMIIDRRHNMRYMHRRISDPADEDERRLAERWRYDTDDTPYNAELDRILINDFDVKYASKRMTLFTENDLSRMVTDPTLPLLGSDGRIHSVVPFRIGGLPSSSSQSRQAPLPRNMPQAPATVTAVTTAPATTTPAQPISTPQLKKMMPPTTTMRLPANGTMRPPSAPLVASIPAHMPTAITQQQTQPQPINVGTRPSINVPHIEIPKQEGVPNVGTNTALFNSLMQAQAHSAPTEPTNGENVTNGQVTQPKSELVPTQYLPLNGYTSYPAHAIDMTAYKRYISLQMASNGTNFNMQLPPGTNMNLKLPPGRQMQWTAAVQSRPGQVNGIVETTNGVPVSMSPNMTPAVVNGGTPTRAPSVNGIRATMRTPISVPQNIHSNPHAMSMSPPHVHASPSPMPINLPHGSPPRIPATPVMTMSSPPLHPHVPVVGHQGS